MPPPLLANWEPVRATAIALGSLAAAAAAHGIDPSAVRQRASREKWPVGARVIRTLREAQAAADSAVALAGATSAAHIAPVAPVTSSVAIAADHAAHGQRGRLAASRASAKALEAIADMDAGEIIEGSRALRDLTAVSGQAGGWEAAAPATAGVNISVLSLGGEVLIAPAGFGLTEMPGR